ncbi:MAG: hypothetical protein IPJ40_20305 [Saprospirales bacterium]|nr:hypothetical protein [Saprospirales bacterium]
MRITHVGFEMHSRGSVLLNEDLDLGTIHLGPEYQPAGGARKGEHIPIAIRNDTIEYNASALSGGTPPIGRPAQKIAGNWRWTARAISKPRANK